MSVQAGKTKKNPLMKRLKWPFRIGIPLLIIGGMYFYFGRTESQANSLGTTFTVTRGPMEIAVLEGGSVEADQSMQIKSEVEGTTKILALVEEGSLVTPQDVANGKVLVELDKKELEDKLVEEKLQFQNALATFTEAKEQYGIQVNQNESDVKAAELEVKFARLDLEKYLGVDLAGKIIGQVETRTVSVSSSPQASSENEGAKASPPPAEALVPPAEAAPEAVPAPAPEESTGGIEVESVFISTPAIDFSKYADPKLLGDGEARQTLRKYENDVVLSEEEVGLASTQLEGTQRLFEKDFVTKNDLDNDNMKLKRSTISKESAETTKDLFVKYEFPKEAETRLSKYEEALRKLERAKRLAVSKLAQAEALLNSAQARYELQSRKLEELQTQITNCTIRATKPGLVIYGTGDPGWRDDDRIQEGTIVRNRQVIITIPDTTVMNVKVKVHESYVKRVKKGLPTRVHVDAYPDRELQGTVKQIAVLPDSENRWMNPDLKIYSTLVTIDGMHDWLKPGMSAQAEIIVDTLKDVVQVPMQAVQLEKDQQVVYVSTITGPQARPVKTGDYNDTMIQVLEGLEPGEVVLLRAPKKLESSGEEEGEKEKGKEEKPEQQAPPSDAAPTASAAATGKAA